MSAIGVLTIGETMARFTGNTIGPLDSASSTSIGIGGAESNVAIGLARLGVKATWLGRVGADPLGRLVRGTIVAQGVNTMAIEDVSAPTGMMLKEHRSTSATRVWYYRFGSAGSRLRASDLDQVDFAHVDLLHITGITPALSDSAAQAVGQAVSLARAAHVPVSFDVNLRRRLWGDRNPADLLRPLVESADIVFGGEEELQMFAPNLTGHELAETIARLGPAQVIVKLGDRGAVAFIDRSPITVPVVPAVVQDTVGAGDAFVAGYLAELLGGAPPPSRLALAAQVAAMVCEVEGDWEGLPSRIELSEFRAAEHVVR